MAEKVRVAVIGAGWWGCEAHLPALRDHPKAEIVAVQSRKRAKAEQIAADFGVPHACETVEELLGIDGLDAVIVSSTPNAHHDQAKAALERGLHVLLEKPMTLTLAEAEELVDLARLKNLHFLISCPWHYTPHAAEARRILGGGLIGDIKMVSILMTNFCEGLYQSRSWEEIFGDSPTLQNTPDPYRKPGQTSYSDASVAGGGQIFCQVAHAAAYLGLLTASDPVEVFARFENAGAPVDVYDTLNIRLANDAIVSIASTGATMDTERNYEIRVYGTEGMVLLELWKGEMAHHDRQGNINKVPDIDAADIYPMFEPAKNLVDVIAGDAENLSPADLGLYSMKIIEAACRSASTKENVLIADL
jgi:predicted dehydrogenase